MIFLLQITQVKLQWNAKPKVGSLENSTYKPGGGDKKIETVKLDFKEKAKPKVASKDNVKHVPGGGTVKVSFSFIFLHSILTVSSKKLTSLRYFDNVQHAVCLSAFLVIYNYFKSTC